MKSRFCILGVLIALCVLALSACNSAPENSTEPYATPDAAATAAPETVSEPPDEPEGEPVPTNITAKDWSNTKFDGDFFTGAAGTYVNVPDVATAIGVPPAVITFGYSYDGMRAEYIPDDVGEAMAAIEELLTQADFVCMEKISVARDFHAELEPNPTEIVYGRAVDFIWISLSTDEDKIIVRYAVDWFSFGDNEENPDGVGDGTAFEGESFDRSYFDTVLEKYGDTVPDINATMGIPAFRYIIEGESNRVTALYVIDNPEVRAESFAMTLTGAGYELVSEDDAGAVYEKDSVRVSLQIELWGSGSFADAAITIETIGD